MQPKVKQSLLLLTGMALIGGVAGAQEMVTRSDVREAVDRIEKHGDEFKDRLKDALANVNLSAREQRARELAQDLEDEVDNLKHNYEDGQHRRARENLDNAMMMAASVDRFMQRSYFGPEVRRAWRNLATDLNVIAVAHNIQPIYGVAAPVIQSADRIQTGAFPDKMRARLERQVRHELVMLPYYGVFDSLAYRVDGDTVTLTGQVTRPTLKSGAEQVVRQLEGVERVVNAIEVLPLSPNDDRIRLATYRAVYGHSALNRYALQAVPSIHIIVKNGHATLDGVAANAADRNIAVMQARSVPGVFSVTDQLRIE
jgi:hyperosmotically inducible protein